MSIYKVDACGDTVYVSAKTQEAAKERLFEVMGEIPTSLLTFTEVDKLPKGETYL